jgi:hypothetical protein
MKVETSRRLLSAAATATAAAVRQTGEHAAATASAAPGCERCQQCEGDHYNPSLHGVQCNITPNVE